MIGELKGVNVRTVHQKKVVRLEIDIPYTTMKDSVVDGKDALGFLHGRVGGEVGFEITALSDQSQESISNGNSDKLPE